MKMKKYVLMLPGLWLVINLCSCVAPKTILAEDLVPDSVYAVTVHNEMIIKPDDKLSITVHSAKPELAIPFNMGENAFRMSADGEVTATDDGMRREGYMVDPDGFIDFPVLGKIHVAGLTRYQLSAYIKEQLIKGNLIDDPIVITELRNLRISVLGEVQRVGVLTAGEGRMTVVEAITRAGGLTGNALPEKIAVIRTQGGSRKVLMVNFRSKELFDSPAYFLQQNDIVFAYPRSSRNTEQENRSWRNYSTMIGLISLATTLLWYLKN